MAPQFGRLTTQLSEQTIPPDDRFCEEINRLIAPATPLTPDQIFVAAMYLVSDQINSFGGRFPVDEHSRLAELLVDSPVLVGHRKDTLPIARNFRAEMVDRGNEHWVKSYFYWLSGSQGAESLKANIDGGLYKECSIAFTYNLPECSICGDDIRNCEHEPGESYSGEAGDAICHFNYRQIDRVLESSLVYRGAVPNTLVTTEGLTENQSDSAEATDTPGGGPRLSPIGSLESLPRDHRYLVVPRYDAIPVLLSDHEGRITVTKFDRTPIKVELAESPLPGVKSGTDPRMALLVGLQGRRRCSRREVEQYLAGKASRVTRLVVTAYPDTRHGNPPTKRRLPAKPLRTLPHRIARWSELPQMAAQIATRDGVEIWALGSDPLTDTGYLYSTDSTQTEIHAPDYCLIQVSLTRGETYLTIKAEGKTTQFALRDFGSTRHTFNRYCLADQTDPIDRDLCTGEDSRAALRGHVVAWSREGRSLRLEVDSPECTVITLRPVILNCRSRLLVRFQSASQKVRGRHANG